MDGYRAVVLKPGTIELQAFEVPAPGPNEVVIRTRKTLISPGTERAFFLSLPNAVTQYPKAVGYCHVGEVVQRGEEVTTLNIGDRVASKSRHASHVIVDAEKCHRLPPELADDDAVFFQLLTISLLGVRKARLEIGEAVAVIGAGPIGLLAIQAARVAGALPVIAVDRDEDRLKFALQMGADSSLSSDANLDSALPTQAGAVGVPVVVEATGNPQAVLTAFQIAAPGGRVILLGSSRGETENVNFYRDVHKKGLTIIGAHLDTSDRLSSAPGWWTLYDEQQTALKLLQHKRVNVQRMITHRFGSEAFVEAYDLLAQWDMSVMGILIDWTSG